MLRLLLLILTAVALVGSVVVPLNPVNSKLLNLCFLVCVFGVWIGLTVLFWKRKVVRFVLIGAALIVVSLMLLPGRSVDVVELRSLYVGRLGEFENCPYYWGGENARGIDCSGLPRRAFRDALLSYGIRNLNGRAIRAYAEQWWYDSSAKALGHGYRSFTLPLDIEGEIRSMEYEALLPGDLAMTKSGVHMVVFSGEDEWIQADPGLGKVKTLNGRRDENSWFGVPVSMHRWTLLSEK